MFRTGIRSASLFASLSIVACGSPAMIGDECTDNADCEEGLSCFEHELSDTNVCMEDCDLTTTRLCEGGLVCTPHTEETDRPPELGVCYLGGATPTGTTCQRNLECEPGSICVCTGTATECMDEPETFQQCYRACRLGDSTCDAGEVCTGLEGMGTNGFCQPST